MLERQSKRGPVEALENKPSLDMKWFWVFEAWCTLSKLRSAGPNRPNPISFMEMRSFAELLSCSHEETFTFLRLVQSLEEEFFEFVRAKQNAHSSARH